MLKRSLILFITAGVLAIACAPAAAPAAPAPTSAAPAVPAPAQPTAAPVAPAPTTPVTPAPFRPAAPAPTTQPSATPLDGGVALTLVSGANEARYRVREELANLPAPIDAVGKTQQVSGAIVLDKSGKVVPAQSKITINLASLTSDESRRDGFIQRRTLETSQFPNAIFTVTEITGLPAALPNEGDHTFKLTGDLTIKDVTKPVSWDVTASFSPQEVTGSANTSITFEQFELDKPSVLIVLSLADTLKLEIDFTATRGN